MNSNTQQKAVIYVRVSSLGQVTKGHGAESQAVRCAEYAKHKGYEIVRIFEDKAVSGSVIDRPGMKQMLSYLRDHSGDNIRVIIDDISRLARGLEAHLALRAALNEAGGVLESPSLEFGEGSDEQLIEHLLATVSEHQRTKNAEQTRNRMRARMTSGYWPFGPVTGFKMENKAGQGKVLVRDEPLASIIQEGLEGFASGRFQTQVEVKRFFEGFDAFPKAQDGTVRIQFVTNILERVLYAGMIESKDWNIPIQPARHEGLISFETYTAIQDRIAGRKCAPYRPDLREDFPLRGVVACACCSKPMTACYSKSKTGKRHPYYVCYQKGCEMKRKSIRRADIEGAFDDLLQKLIPGQPFLKLVTAMFKDAWDLQAAKAKQALREIDGQLDGIDVEVSKLVDRIVSASQPRVIDAYEQKIEKLERDKLILREKAASQPSKRRSFDETFELCLKFLTNPYKIWRNGPFEAKRMVLRMVFSKPIAYCRENGFRTPETTSVFGALQRLQHETCKMVHPRGFEPLTSAFGGQRSIQLSYGC